jgi:hypothetical protein
MNNPHVETLFYRFVSENYNDKFDQAKPFKGSLDSFDVELADGILTVIPHKHYPDEESVKLAFEPLLHSWESAAFLDPSRYRVRFIYSHADVVDLSPTPSEGNIQGRSAGMAVVAGRITGVRGMPDYPAPAFNFAASSLTNELIDLLKRYHDRRIPLTAMTYLFLTTLEREFGNRKEVSKALNIQWDVLQMIGYLSDTTDPKHRRKARGQGPSKLSHNQVNWLETVGFVTAKRVGELNAGVTSISQIRMSDLPKL